MIDFLLCYGAKLDLKDATGRKAEDISILLKNKVTFK